MYEGQTKSLARNAFAHLPQNPILFIPWLVDNLPKYADCVIITHVLEVDLINLRKRARSEKTGSAQGKEGELGLRAFLQTSGTSLSPHTQNS